MNRVLLPLLLICAGTAFGQVNLTLGLRAYYPFSGNANDVSGNNNNPNFNNATLTADRFGNANSAYRFNGTNNYMRIPNSPTLNMGNAHSISAWVRPTGFYTGTCHGNSVVMKGNTDYLTGNYHIRFDDNFYTNGQNCVNPVVDVTHQNFYGVDVGSSPPGYTPYIQVNQWYHVVVTSDGTTSRLYVNCELKSSQPQTATTFTNSHDLFFGTMNNPSYPYWLNGDLDEVRIYNRALNLDEINVLGGCVPTLTCNNWASLPSYPSYISVGDLDVPGTQVTVEAMFNRTAPYTNGYNWAGDIVSKHEGPIDVNYLLRPNNAEITTSNGFFTTPPICEIELNKTYHAAMVYDGVTLKFYRNGFLMSSVPATGTMYQNNHPTRIGLYDGLVHNTNLIGYVNEVRIWNVARSQTDIRTYMNTSLPSPASQAGLQAYYVFDNLNNRQGNPAWNGTVSSGASINNSNPACAFTPDSCAVVSCNIDNDFAFKRNACNPLNVQFSTSATGYDNIKWDFGDGNNANAVATASHTYAATGIYEVSLITNYGVCPDTVKKTVAVDLVNDIQLIATPDTTICLGTTKKLRTQPALSYCWTPSTHLDNPLISEPTTSTPSNITYYFTAEVAGTNLVNNGNFSAGNTGFTSQYNYAMPNVTEGQYFVGNSPQAWNPSLSNCTDHTGGNGNMLLVNGSPTADVKVWTQTVNITPNTNYAFSTWVQALFAVNPAQLQFSINGNDVGQMITASLPTCTWTQFYTTWNSGSNVSAVISIVNKNTLVAGNDFALDDISFAPVFMKRDSVKISVDTPSVVTNNNSSVCSGSFVQLNTTGATTYSWTPATGLSNPNIGNPIATPAVTTQYIVTGINANGCTGKDTVVVDVLPKPMIGIHNDTSICRNSSIQLFATGGSTYAWTPGATLNDPASPNPIASPADSTMYYVTVTDNNNCSNTDSVIVDIVDASEFGVGPDIETCFNEPIQLSAYGGDTYSWSPAGTLDNPSIPNPIANPSGNTIYTVTITETTCNESATLSIAVSSLPLPVVRANKANDIDCTQPSSQLVGSGAATYTWTPAATLNNPGSGSPTATPITTTQYYVTGTDVNGCSNKDSVIVNVDFSGTGGYLMPTGFTPNGDGLNDCYGIKYWGAVIELDFSIYNRWGERVFRTTTPGVCWDGTYKGVKQDPAVFVYMIRAKTACDPSVFRKGTFVLIR